MKPRPYNALPIVAAGDAPVAFRWDEQVRRFYRGKLFAPLQRPGAASTPYDEFISLIESDYKFPAGFGQLQEGDEPGCPTVLAIVIDQTVWIPAEEPRYVILTAGAGNNHGGTHLLVHGFTNTDIPVERTFPATKLDEAIAEAERLAEARGDTRNLPITANHRIEVLHAPAVRYQPIAA